MIAVTGAAGFIGSTLAHRLAAAGHDLLLVDESLTAAKAANLAGLDSFRYLGHDRFPGRARHLRPGHDLPPRRQQQHHRDELGQPAPH